MTASDRYAVVGDVHGDVVRLTRLLTLLSEDKDRTVIFTGDYVNRGPSSSQVLTALIDAQTTFRRLLLLAGNHELAMLEYLNTGCLPPFAAHGGMATIRSYVLAPHGDVHAQLRSALPAQHEHLLNDGLLTYFEDDHLLVSHTGYNSLAPYDRSVAQMTTSPHPNLFADPVARSRRPRPTVVFGHYVQRSGIPWAADGLYCLDTGCGTLGGDLTALLLPEHSFITV